MTPTNKEGRLANNKVLVLCSGGVDSVVAAMILREEGFQVSLLLIAYGSRAEAAEHFAMKQLSAHLQMPLEIVTVPIGKVVESGLLSHSETKSEDLKTEVAFVPARNLILLSVAAARAVTNGFGYLAHGNIADGIYPDNKPAFTYAMNQVLPHAIGPKAPAVLAPVNYLPKWQVVVQGKRLKAPFHLTWSCYSSGDVHCGKCGSCVSRQNAFTKAGVVDPVEYKL